MDNRRGRFPHETSRPMSVLGGTPPELCNVKSVADGSLFAGGSDELEQH